MHENGDFEAQFTADQLEGVSALVLEFESGASLSYRMHCDERGWYFPDNGLAEKNRLVFDKIFDAPAEAATLYLSSSGSEEEAAEVREKLKQISDSATRGLTDDYEKARALSAYVASNFYYDHDARAESVTEENVSLNKVLENARTICIGFSNLYCALLQAQGIDAVSIKGGAASGEVTYEMLTDGVQNHEFAAFWYEAEQRWVWADPCWNGSGDYINGEYHKKICHEKYFDITDEALALNHRADYAERRSFFTEQELPEQTMSEQAEQTSSEQVSPEQTSPDTPAETEETTSAPQTAETTAPETKAPVSPEAGLPEQDNTSLYSLAAVLAAGILCLAIYILVKKRKDH